MLASITPLGERGRQSTWGTTVTAFALGASATGMAAGAGLGELGTRIIPRGVGAEPRLGVLVVALLGALVLDTFPRAVPGPSRQVNHSWLDEYRGWVYGLGYGAQLGLGATTVVTSAGTYAALVAALLSGSALSGALIFGCYGAVRGITPLAAARIRTTGQLLTAHVRLARWRHAATWGGRAGLAAAAALALTGWLG